MDELKDAIRRIAGVDYEIYDGFVVAVDQDKMTCDVKVFDSDDSILKQVSLRSVANGEKTGLILVPADDAHVVFCKIEGQSDYTLVNCSELDKVIIDVSVKVEINAPETVFNDGNNGGLVVVGSCVDKLNAIEQDVNDLKELLQTALGTTVTEQGNGAPSALQIALDAALNNWYGKKIKETKVDDIENKKVKH